ncbi:MAG: bifunctional cytidylyltransferase/SDR family oxidoreductase [Rhizomicrobium sp.]
MAIILAGGSGRRFGQSIPKQFTPLAGRPLLDYPLQVFADHPEIDELVVAYPDGFREEVEAIAGKYAKLKPVKYVQGGSSRAASTRAALGVLEGGARKKLLFHDAVRPFVDSDIIRRCILALDSYDATDVVVEAADTIVELEPESGILKRIPNRTLLRRGQTPQGFWSDILAAAYEVYSDDDLSRFTDDCGVLLSVNPRARIAAIEGSDTNLKITRMVDLFLAEQLLYLGQAHGIALDRPPLTDPTAIVVGDTSGLGLIVKQRLERKGWRIFGASRSMGVDVRNQAAVEKHFSDVVAQSGKIDMVANFAGVLHVGRLNDADATVIDEVVSTNLLGSINVARSAFPHLQQTKGQLVLCSSSSYFRGRRDTAAYSASKAAVVNLTQALADEWRDDGIAVGCIVPRRADTPMRQKAFPNEDPGLRMRPELVADAMEEMLATRHPGQIKHVY